MHTNDAAFDLSKVKTIADEPQRKEKRIFGIQEAPTFYPTKDEFKDPLGYIEKISPEGEKYGIIKIVPPNDYHPEFSLNTKSFRFKTRIQKLNSMEGETRTNVNYLEQLTKYHILTGKPVAKIPQLDKRPIDLYKLKNEVALRGGIQQVTRLKKWAEIGRNLGYARKQCTSLSNSLKTAYQKLVLPYEIWYAKHKDDVDKIISSESNDEDSDTCEICQKNENEQELLLCDGCNRGYHMYCLNPPLSSVPKSDWYCLHCLTAIGKDYGFEDGDEYSLNDFHEFAEKFKKNWFHKLNGDDRPVSEEDCENEFWRLVENPHETCQVEYGADLHSTQHGSGFVNPEQMPQGEFDPWNLNVIPVVPQSLFTHIKTDISGMMVPWLYIGMCFSAFCWHNEDHYTYSINYMHWGETKTWYGVPGSDTAKFEAAMKKAMPELFEQQPDLLFQLVTMLSPGRLVQHNVKVYAVDQRPGQFVVTYPKAYHSGFNHGFNFCEAVNFAPGKWVDYGLECVKLYKAFRKQPCFSHDELLITAAQNIQMTEKDDWLKRGLVELRERELGERSRARSRRLKEQVISEDDEEQESQCVFCHCYTYLSFIGCKCTEKVVCLDHMSELCSCENSSKTLYLRFTDRDLEDLTRQVIELGTSPEDWIDKVDKAITSSTTIKTLKDLLKEGYDINVPQESLDTLRDCIEFVDQYNTEAEKVLNLKSDSFKNGKKRSYKLDELLEKADLIGFDLPCFDMLKEYKSKLDDFNDRLARASDDTTTQISLYNEGTQLRADSPEFIKLRNVIESSSWEDQVQQVLTTTYNSKNMRKLIKDGEDMGMTTENNSLLRQLIGVEEFGRSVLQRIDNICKGREKISLDKEDELLDIGRNDEFSIILDPQSMARLKSHLSRSKKTLDEIEDILIHQSQKPTVMERAPITEAHRLMSLCRELTFKSDLVPELASELSRMGAWNEQVRAIFMNGRQKSLETVLKETLSNVQRITASEGKSGLWCVCRKAESGLMIECDTCCEWYHSSCLKISRNVVRSTNSYICPICNPSENNRKITHLSRQPKLEEVSDLITQSESLKFRPKDYQVILGIYATMQGYRNRVQAFCRSRTQLGVEDLPKIKYYLRTLMGLEVYLQDETEFLTAKVQALSHLPQPENKASHKLASIKNEPVKPVTSKFQELDECLCQKTDKSKKLVKCPSCKHSYHTDCVQYKEDGQFKCPLCVTKSAVKASANKPPNAAKTTVSDIKQPVTANNAKKPKASIAIRPITANSNSTETNVKQPTTNNTTVKTTTSSTKPDNNTAKATMSGTKRPLNNEEAVTPATKRHSPTKGYLKITLSNRKPHAIDDGKIIPTVSKPKPLVVNDKITVSTSKSPVAKDTLISSPKPPVPKTNVIKTAVSSPKASLSKDDEIKPTVSSPKPPIANDNTLKSTTDHPTTNGSVIKTIVSGEKRSASDDINAPPRPQKIIKLTIKPPAEPPKKSSSHHKKKRHHEHKSKKQKM